MKREILRPMVRIRRTAGALASLLYQRSRLRLGECHRLGWVLARSGVEFREAVIVLPVESRYHAINL